jgi:drug/metabolite transporter (DMT)-like permease
MVYLVGVFAAASIGLGWVLQQHAAVRRADGDPLSPRLVVRLVRDPGWWLGLAAITTGNALWALSLYLGTVSTVEPLLGTSLVFAFGFAAVMHRRRPSSREVLGALIVVAALAGFVLAGHPQAATDSTPSPLAVALAVVLVAVVVLGIVGVARRQSLAVASTAFAAAAGVLYGLQDVSARWALVTEEDRGLASLLTAPGAYLVAATAVGGLLLSQCAFGAARLARSLPSLTVSEPLVGIALGAALLGDRVSGNPAALTAELICLVSLIAGVTLVGRSFHAAPPPVVLQPLGSAC